mgnify:CR=1 FL=1
MPPVSPLGASVGAQDCPSPLGSPEESLAAPFGLAPTPEESLALGGPVALAEPEESLALGEPVVLAPFFRALWISMYHVRHPSPAVILADEPVSALDVSIQSQILNLLLKLRDELSLTMIFISHDLSVVRFLADNIAVMKAGKIVEYDTSRTIFEEPQHPYTQTLLNAIPRIELPA